MQRALRNTLMTEDGTEKLDKELITTVQKHLVACATTPFHRRKNNK